MDLNAVLREIEGKVPAGTELILRREGDAWDLFLKETDGGTLTAYVSDRTGYEPVDTVGDEYEEWPTFPEWNALVRASFYLNHGASNAVHYVDEARREIALLRSYVEDLEAQVGPVV